MSMAAEDKDDQFLLDAIRAAAARNRWVFAATTVTCVLHISGLWNAYLSWLRLYALGYAEGAVQPASVAAQSLIRGWVDSTFLAVPLIGLRVSAFDSTIVGAFALNVLVLWRFFCLRRENHLVAYTFTQAYPQAREVQSRVFAAVWSTQVFSTSRDDSPVYSVPAHRRDISVVWGTRGALKALMYLPVATIAASVLAELVSLFVPSPFRPGGASPLESVSVGGYIMVAVIVGIGLVLCTAAAFLCGKCVTYQNATGKILAEAVSRGWGHAGHGPDSETRQAVA